MCLLIIEFHFCSNDHIHSIFEYCNLFFLVLMNLQYSHHIYNFYKLFKFFKRLIQTRNYIAYQHIPSNNLYKYHINYYIYYQ